MPSVIIVGSGIAGLVAALRASSTHDVTVVTKNELSESNTRYAQGGIAAAMSADDSVLSHVEDTLAAGNGLNTRSVVEILCAEGPARIRTLLELGVPFDRVDGELSRGREAAHSVARVLHARGDSTGAAIEDSLVAAVRASRIRIRENLFVTDLVSAAGRIVGIDTLTATGEAQRLFADSVILASGGAGQLYSHTTNPAVATGDGLAAAARAGAVLSDLEFFQFHPTSLARSGNFLISEAVRGEGATIIDAVGRRFLFDSHPDGELAPRDVVSRGIAQQMARQNEEPVFLDATALGSKFLAERFPSIDAATRQAGLRWGEDPIPVSPAAHYFMGGVATDEWGRTSIPGLFAIGEVACTGVHGANRLASNSLLESLVFAWRSVQVLDNHWPTWQRPGLAPELEAAERVETSGAQSGELDRSGLQRLMWRYAGVFRDATGLRRAAEELAGLPARPPISIEDHENRNLQEIARLIVNAASNRQESRGAHHRSDYPQSNPELQRHLDWAIPLSHTPDLIGTAGKASL